MEHSGLSQISTPSAPLQYRSQAFPGSKRLAVRNSFFLRLHLPSYLEKMQVQAVGTTVCFPVKETGKRELLAAQIS
jgi:hypothetical protein